MIYFKILIWLNLVYLQSVSTIDASKKIPVNELRFVGELPKGEIF